MRSVSVKDRQGVGSEGVVLLMAEEGRLSLGRVPVPAEGGGVSGKKINDVNQRNEKAKLIYLRVVGGVNQETAGK